MISSVRYPPINYLYRISKNCPKSMLLYLRLWQLSDDKNTLKIAKDEIKNNFFFSRTKFSNTLYNLVSEGLCSVIESDEAFEIMFKEPSKEEEKDQIFYNRVDIKTQS